MQLEVMQLKVLSQITVNSKTGARTYKTLITLNVWFNWSPHKLRARPVCCQRFRLSRYADQDLDFWCSAPPQIVDHFKVVSATGQTIEGKYVESCFLPEMLANRRIKAATRKILNAMAHAQKSGINITALGGFSSIIFENFKLDQIKRVRNLDLDFKKFTTGNTHTGLRHLQAGRRSCTQAWH